MIAAWILYASIVAAFFALAGTAAERVARSLGRPTRGVWLASIAATIAWPFVALMTASRAAPSTETGVAVLPPLVSTVHDATATVLTFLGTRGAVVDALLIAVWCIASVALLARLARARLRLHGESRTWTEREVDGVRVLVSDDVGPAVIGIRPMRVVLPAWSLVLDGGLRAMIMRHEEEHQRARDPHVLLISTVLAVLAPWNIALWWQIQRLRLAVEMDCDARVLRAHPRADRYGMLLVAIAQRRSLPSGVLAPALAEPISTLERRIIAMRSTPSRFRLATALSFSALAAAAVVIACSADAPSSTGTTEDQVTPSTTSSTATTDLSGTTVLGKQSSERSVVNPTASADLGESTVLGKPLHRGVSAPTSDLEAKPIPGTASPRYPDMLRSANVEGEVLAQFVIDENGKVDMGTFKVLKSTHELFTNSVKDALTIMRFTPPELNGKKVRKMVQMPFEFRLNR